MGADDLLVALEAKDRFGAQLLAYPDVHGVGVGRRRRSGQKTDEFAVVVHVERKLPAEAIPAARRLPAGLTFVTRDGRKVNVPVDVQEQAIPAPEVDRPATRVDLQARIRPVPGGYSVGSSTSGTLGGWVWDTITKQVVALSNEHVFGSVPGSVVLQPSRSDGGRLTEDRIAQVVRAGALDAAVAQPVDNRVISASIADGGPAVFEITDATIDMVVQKTGQTTGLTSGVVDLINYDHGHHGSRSDLFIDGNGDDFSSGGDSGALYLERNNPNSQARWRRVIGLHWGGSGSNGVGHHIRPVFDDLGLAPLPANLLG